MNSHIGGLIFEHILSNAVLLRIDFEVLNMVSFNKSSRNIIVMILIHAFYYSDSFKMHEY